MEKKDRTPQVLIVPGSFFVTELIWKCNLALISTQQSLMRSAQYSLTCHLTMRWHMESQDWTLDWQSITLTHNKFLLLTEDLWTNTCHTDQRGVCVIDHWRLHRESMWFLFLITIAFISSRSISDPSERLVLTGSTCRTIIFGRRAMLTLLLSHEVSIAKQHTVHQTTSFFQFGSMQLCLVPSLILSCSVWQHVVNPDAEKSSDSPYGV